jgi:hypothetical protein
MFQFEFISDIHIKDKCPFMTPTAPILILVGDIGHYSEIKWKEFMAYCANEWKIIIYILGNHEYYHYTQSYDEVHYHYKLYLSQYPNVKILDSHRPSVTIENIAIFGATMWSRLPIEKNTSFYRNTLYKIKEKKYITYIEDPILQKINEKIEDELTIISSTIKEYIDTTSLSPTTWNMLHEQDMVLLLSFLNKKRTTNIIATHFPIFKVGSTDPKYEDEDYVKSLYASDAYISVFNHLFPDIDTILSIPEYNEKYPLDLEEMNNELPTYIFLSGHTHYNFTYAFKYRNTNFLFVSNNQPTLNIETCFIEI